MLGSRFGYFSCFLRTLPALALALAALSACSGESAPGDAPSQGTGAPDDAGGACNVEPTTVTGLDQTHVATCSEVSYPDNPPAGGNHYSQWAAFQSYSFPVPRGFWVHDLEHGAVVYSYNCPDGCAEEVAKVQALIDALPADPLCSADTERRVVLTPDPLLDVRWGVSAWGFSLRADCVDSQRFQQFYLNHFARGPENLCNPGTDFGGTPPCQ
jgi:hypothetical protein